MKFYKILTLTLILATTLPFFLFINQIDYSLLEFSEELFYNNLILTFASIFGFIGGILLMWENLLGNRFIIKNFSSDQIWFNKLHMWIGKYGLLLLFVHPILSLYGYGKDLLWIFLPNLKSDFEIHLTYGRLAFMIFLVIYFTSALIRGKIKYRPWLYIHYLAYPMLFLSFLHAIEIGNFLDSIPILKTLWLSLFAIFVILFIHRLLCYAGIFSEKYEVISKTFSPNNSTIITLKPLSKKLFPKAGQYFYFQLNHFGETHPFSFIDFHEESGELKFAIKNFGKFTEKISNLNNGDQILLDGPYGVFTNEAQNPHPKVILAGGIGITPFIYLLKNFSNKFTFLLYSNGYLHDAIFRIELKEFLGTQYYDFISREEIKGENILCCYLDKQKLLEVLGEDLSKYNFFICGSKRYIQGIKKTLFESKVPEEHIFTEQFY